MSVFVCDKGVWLERQSFAILRHMNGDYSPQGEGQEDQAKRKSDSYTSPESYVAVFRSEILSEEAGSGRLQGLISRLRGFDWRKLLAVLGAVILLGMCLLVTLGPGRPFLEGILSSLAKTPQVTESVLAGSTQPFPTRTAAVQVTSTTRPSLTPTATQTRVPATATRRVTLTVALSPTPSLTPGPECVEAISISLEDVGKTLCGRGVIVRTENRPNGFLVIFKEELGQFMLVTYDLEWTDGEPGMCIQFEGEVQQLGQAPVIVFGWTSLPIPCP